MPSAARYIVLYGPLHLPFILPHNAMVYAVLWKAHTILACHPSARAKSGNAWQLSLRWARHDASNIFEYDRQISKACGKQGARA